MTRGSTRRINLGGVPIGGGAPVSVQTMGTRSPYDAAAILEQMNRAVAAGCDIFRLAVPDLKAVETLREVCRRKPLPVVADVHFDYRIAVEAVNVGIDGLRINPGNIGGADRVKAVVAAVRPKGLPIRIGVNGGSLEKDILAKYGTATAEALVESALRHVRLLEEQDYREIKISVKASDVPRTLAAYRLLSSRTDYPLHLGVTEAGTFLAGTVRSCVAMGALLLEGIGDTIRVSLTDEPEQEVKVGVELLCAAGLRQPRVHVTSCPTCGRTQADVIATARKVEEALENLYRETPDAKRLHVAVMGCVVNGPGEAAGADLALCGGKGTFALYEKGERIGVVPEGEAVAWILKKVREA